MTISTKTQAKLTAAMDKISRAQTLADEAAEILADIDTKGDEDLEGYIGDADSIIVQFTQLDCETYAGGKV